MSIPVEVLQKFTEGNGAFDPSVPGLQTAWDSSSLGPLKTCPRKYYYSMIMGYGVSSIHLDFGAAIHKALESFDKDMASGTEFDQALRNAVRRAMEVSASWGMTTPQKNRETLVRSVIWYILQFQEDVYETLVLNGKPAVELTFSFPFFEGHSLCGHLDRIASRDGVQYIHDRKTTGGTISPHFFKKFTPDNQMSLYAAAGRIVFEANVIGVVIDGIQLAVGFTRFERGFALRSESFVEEWLEDTKEWIKLAEGYAEARSWPMNDTACDMYGGCHFRPVCSKPKEVRQAFLDGGFERRKWDPTVAR